MNRGLYISGTSLLANEKRLDVVSNNLSNLNTSGYKKDVAVMESFPQVLLSKINDTSEYNMNSRSNEITYENEDEIHYANTEKGYFTIETSMGKSYVKNIRFTIDDDGYLRTFYKNDKSENKTDWENYILDKSGNRITAQAGNVEGLLDGIVTYPPPQVIGTLGSGVKFQKIVTNFSQGQTIETGRKLDVALEGSGFFKVEGEDGQVFYTRDGTFDLNSEGELVTQEGYRVLGSQGYIVLDNDDVSINKRGQIVADGDVIDSLDVVDLENKEYLRKIGNNSYKMLDDVEGEEVDFNGEIFQGFIEQSNVDSIKEMVEMITLLRNFESSQKVIKMQDEMLGKASNEIGRI